MCIVCPADCSQRTGKKICVVPSGHCLPHNSQHALGQLKGKKSSCDTSQPWYRVRKRFLNVSVSVAGFSWIHSLQAWVTESSPVTYRVCRITQSNPLRLQHAVRSTTKHIAEHFNACSVVVLLMKLTSSVQPCFAYLKLALKGFWSVLWIMWNPAYRILFCLINAVHKSTFLSPEWHSI